MKTFVAASVSAGWGAGQAVLRSRRAGASGHGVWQGAEHDVWAITMGRPGKQPHVGGAEYYIFRKDVCYG